MDDVTFPAFVRGLLISACLVIGGGFALRLIQSNRWNDAEHKLLYGGVILAIIALAGRSIVAIQDGDPLVWPLIFLAASLVCFGLYLTSPRGRHK